MYLESGEDFYDPWSATRRIHHQHQQRQRCFYGKWKVKDYMFRVVWRHAYTHS